MGVDSNVSQQKPFGVRDSKLVLIKSDTAFINMVTIPRQTMFTVYVTTSTATR